MTANEGSLADKFDFCSVEWFVKVPTGGATAKEVCNYLQLDWTQNKYDIIRKINSSKILREHGLLCADINAFKSYDDVGVEEYAVGNETIEEITLNYGYADIGCLSVFAILAPGIHFIG
ncbi:hypothetical protein IWW52_002979 [Coemansia sp. RSA 2704]|nr:hypothetical protein IWW52_002979 [Coemansia sp. RSA 2704]